MHFLQNPQNISRLFPKWAYIPAGFISIIIASIIIKSILPTYPIFEDLAVDGSVLSYCFEKAKSKAGKKDGELEFQGVRFDYFGGSTRLDKITVQYGKPHSVIKVQFICNGKYSIETDNTKGMEIPGKSFHTYLQLSEEYFQINSIIAIVGNWLEENQVSGWTTVDTVQLGFNGSRTTWRIDFHNNIHQYPIYLEIDPVTKEIIRDPYNEDF